LSFLLRCRETGFLCDSAAGFVLGPALRFFLRRNASFLFSALPSFLLVRQTGFLLSSVLCLLLPLDALGFCGPLLERLCILAKSGVPAVDAEARALDPSRSPQRAHDDYRDRRCERKTEHTDDQKHLHDW
jgi:hypothetical protein